MAPRSTRRRKRGFTLIELLIVMAIIGMLLAIAVPRYFHTVTRARETVLRDDLAILREAIDKHYVRALPVDPFTKVADSWTFILSEDPDHPGIRDLHSGSDQPAADGTPL